MKSWPRLSARAFASFAPEGLRHSRSATGWGEFQASNQNTVKRPLRNVVRGACLYSAHPKQNTGLKSFWPRSFVRPSCPICAPVPINLDHIAPKCSFFTCNLARTVLLLLSTSFDLPLTAIQCGGAEAQLKTNWNQFLSQSRLASLTRTRRNRVPNVQADSYLPGGNHALIRNCRIHIERCDGHD